MQIDADRCSSHYVVDVISEQRRCHPVNLKYSKYFGAWHVHGIMGYRTWVTHRSTQEERGSSQVDSGRGGIP